MPEHKTLSPAKAETAAQRKQRLAAELRANLMKRKAQARARAVTDEDDAVTDATTCDEAGRNG